MVVGQYATRAIIHDGLSEALALRKQPEEFEGGTPRGDCVVALGIGRDQRSEFGLKPCHVNGAYDRAGRIGLTSQLGGDGENCVLTLGFQNVAPPYDSGYIPVPVVSRAGGGNDAQSQNGGDWGGVAF